MSTSRYVPAFAIVLACVGGSAAFAKPRCRSIPGIDSLLTPGRIVLVGEVHGTREMPQLFTELVCHTLAKGLEAVVGFEQIPAVGEAVERYLSSRGSPAERLAIFEHRLSPGDDGTASDAMLDAFEALRTLAVETKRIHTFGFVGGPESNGNLGYAEAVASAHRKAPHAVVLALMGSHHNRLTREADDGGPPVGLLLRQRGLDLRSIYIEFPAGSAYMRGLDGPGSLEPTPSQVGTGKPWVLFPEKSGVYDAFISVGQIHPSLPATKSDARK